MAAPKKIVVLVHGWSVRNTNTYGGLASWLKKRSLGAVDVRNIWLSKYVSFRDEVRLEDLSRAFEAALGRELKAELASGRRFACIAHSTGGPVVRDWWHRFYTEKDKPCPMSHLIMLAPANFGSALAQLGKERVGRLKSWFQGMEPGQGVLDWLELGSPEAWALNRDWITNQKDFTAGPDPVFPFVLTGQTIDRHLYDHLNSYTGESGSDGVVRVAAANLNASYVKLFQKGRSEDLIEQETMRSVPTAFCLIPGRSHSGEEKGILRSVKKDGRRHPTCAAILACLRVKTARGYQGLRERFARRNALLHEQERVEHAPRFLGDRYFLHDPHSMAIVRLTDHYGHPIADYDFVLTGKGDDPNHLAEGFCVDRQRNSRMANMLTYYVNHASMAGCHKIPHPKQGRRPLREKMPGMKAMGVWVVPRPDEGFVRYRQAILEATKANLGKFFRPNETVLMDVVLHRDVGRGAFELVNSDRPGSGKVDFTNQVPGPGIG